VPDHRAHDCRLTQLRQTAGEVTATFSNGRTATGEILVGADGINSATLQLAWPNAREALDGGDLLSWTHSADGGRLAPQG
jgi:2-polyprenyl-6-methoxyphenol hydroxylase-like FAD-dependent oxidoreductase